MARFTFKLRGVLKQRRHEEHDCQRVLAARQSELTDLEQSLKRLTDMVRGSNDDVRTNRLLGALDMSFLTAHRRFLFAAQRQGTEIVQKMALAQKRVDDAAALLAEAAKRRKTIEKLREKQYARWRAERAQKERMLLDEAGMQIAYHNLAEAAR